MLPITAPGVYDIDIDDYHSQRCCDGPSVSSSGLRKILRECPAEFWATSDLNPKHKPPKEKEAFNFGRAAHALVLGEPEFNEKFIVSPFDDFRSKEARAWRDEQTKQIVRVDDWYAIQDMAAAQKESTQLRTAFAYGKPEQSLIWKDTETGIWLKARPDWLPDNPAIRFTVEYKTSETLQPRRLSNAVFDYGYEMQAALALDGIEIVTGVKPLGMAHAVQKKTEPYLAELKLFTSEQIAFGRRQYRKALRILARCLKASEWPGYTEEPTYFETPYHIVKQMESFDDDDGNEKPDSDAADYLAAGQ